MDVSLKTIIDRINQKSETRMFDGAKLSGIEHVLARFPKLSFVGHGVQSICFKTVDGYVVKCCTKRKNAL